jgi:L-ascorbate metabolism protein UlaG (beta-lactamase superfamily)
MLDGITWFRQSSVRIRREGLELHVDPWGITEESEADFILLTHPHYDSFSENDIARVRGPETVVLAPVSMRKQMDQIDHLMRPGDMVSLDGIEILAVPAYNKDKKFHPR